MTLQGEPQPHTAPPTGQPLRSGRAGPGSPLRALVLAGAMIAAITMTPPLSGQSAASATRQELARPESSTALEAASFERHVAPAVVTTSVERDTPKEAPPAPTSPSAAPQVAAPEQADVPPAPAPEPPAAPPAAAPVPAAAVVIPPAEYVAPVSEPVPAPAKLAARTIYIAGSGGQELVDACIGPVHYTPTDAFAVFITEHDYCGGWDRFSGIVVGQTVTLAGYGTYTVNARGQVPLGGTTSDVSAVFGGFPKAVLQTCIPGTNQMLVIALN
ncbi:peptidoglycan-binding protein [Paenarthrobacter sp. 4246]|uniref:peptidoglycan-binding protein n=1 Tax=Paenarthrobacter sp. 4246 TaxID=3156456 RepID=UPI0033971791